MSKAAIVTGAARGIGAATVTSLAEAGWNVLAVDRCSDDPRLPYRLGTREELEDVVSRAGGGASIQPLIGDATSSEDMERAVGTAEREFGGVDAVIAIAGVIAGGVPLWEMPAAQQDAVLDANLRSVLVAARVGIPALLRRPEPRSGRFVAVASGRRHAGAPDAGGVLRRESRRHRCHPGPGRGAPRHRCDGQRDQPGLHRDADPRRERAALRPGVSRGVLLSAADLEADPAPRRSQPRSCGSSIRRPRR